MNLELNIHPLLMFVDIGFEQVSFISVTTMGEQVHIVTFVSVIIFKFA